MKYTNMVKISLTVGSLTFQNSLDLTMFPAIVYYKLTINKRYRNIVIYCQSIKCSAASDHVKTPTI